MVYFSSRCYFEPMQILTTKSGFVFADSVAREIAAPAADGGSWQQQLKWAIRDREELKKRLGLSSKTEDDNLPVFAEKSFPVFVPLPYLARITPGDPHDPLLLQVLPTVAEDETVAGFSVDPLAETAATRLPGMLHKYHGRVLLVTTGACAVNCRYCFRRHFPYEESPRSPRQWESAIQEIADDESIEEVLLSGGDPLTLTDDNLAKLIAQLDSIPHLKRLRIHTRMPIMIPQRITAGLLDTLSGSRLRSVMVVHSNHARELDDAVLAVMHEVAEAGVMLLNQSVLLRGVNDDAQTLIELSQRLLDCRVLPYYLHKNDPVAGTAHFEVSIERGKKLIEAMRASLPGYAVPRFVQELAGEPSKTVLA